MEFGSVHSVAVSQLVIKILGFAFVALQVVALSAQEKTTTTLGSNSLVFPTDHRVQKRFQDAKDFFTQQHWTQGLEILERTVERFPDVMVPLGNRRYVSVSAYRNLVVAALPAEGLAAYRQRVDDEAELWLKAARKFRDPKPLRSILRKAFASSQGDEALELLGNLAWDEGRFETARHDWEQILPPPKTDETNPNVIRLFYPDSNLNLPEIRARCILCSMMLSDWKRVALELESFRKNHSQATGYLAGSEGNLILKLESLAKRIQSQKLSSTFDENDTFAGNPARNRTYSFHDEMKTASWSKSFLVQQSQTKEKLDSPFQGRRPINFPVVHRKNIFLCDDYRIGAIDLQTGKPSWGNGNGKDPGNNNAVIYESPQYRGNAKPDSNISGSPLRTMTISNGKLYARMGNPITHWNSSEFRVKPSSIVCLDIERGEGRLLWSRSSIDFAGKSTFVGSPLVVAGKVILVLQQSHPQKQTHIVCLDSLNGQTCWKRKTYSSISSGDSERNRIEPNFLTYGNGRLFLSTERGGLIAIDAENGKKDWILSYRRTGEKQPKDRANNSIVKPPLFFRERVYIAPSDSDSVFCIEASSGILIWKRRISDRIEHLLGVNESGLIVSGKRLWCLDGESGKLIWHGPIFSDPLGYGFGRGFLTEMNVFWPTRNRIFTFDLQTGMMTSPPIPFRVRNPKASGGNLIPTNHGLLVAEPHRLVFYPKSN